MCRWLHSAWRWYYYPVVMLVKFSCAWDEGMWRSGSTSPLILNLGIRWKWLVSLSPQPGTTWRGGLMGPAAGLEALENIQISCPCRELNHGFLVVLCIADSLYWLSYPGCIIKISDVLRLYLSHERRKKDVWTTWLIIFDKFRNSINANGRVSGPYKNSTNFFGDFKKFETLI
jgi:hypothetical protein